MANSYIAIPNVLPGNVTIGGNLTVAGNVLTIGTFTEKLRLAVDSANQAKLSWNQQGGGSARDNAAKVAQALFLGAGTSQLDLEVQNSAGATMDTAIPETIFSDYTNHGNTGNTTENTIYTKTIRANLLGLNGALRVTVGVHLAVQGVTGTLVRVKLGGTSFLVATLPSADAVGEVIIQGLIFNQNSASVQAAHGLKFGGSVTTVCGDTAGAINTAADAIFSVTAQSGAASDNQTFNFISVELMNIWGPVT